MNCTYLFWEDHLLGDQGGHDLGIPHQLLFYGQTYHKGYRQITCLLFHYFVVYWILVAGLFHECFKLIVGWFQPIPVSDPCLFIFLHSSENTKQKLCHKHTYILYTSLCCQTVGLLYTRCLHYKFLCTSTYIQLFKLVWVCLKNKL